MSLTQQKVVTKNITAVQGGRTCLEGKVVVKGELDLCNEVRLKDGTLFSGDLCICGRVKELKAVGYIGAQSSPQFKVNEFYELWKQKWPAKLFKSHVLTVNRTDDGIGAVVDEIEAKVNEYKECGINHIMIETTSPDTEPFILGTEGSLGGVHSDLRHPNVTFYPFAQGTTAVDGASQWVRYVDFRSTTTATAELALPAPGAGKQFILGTDNSAAVLATQQAWLDVATTRGYTIVSVDLMWNGGTYEFDNIAAFDAAILAAPAGSVVGLCVSASSENSFWERYDDLTVKGTASPNVFNPGNANVTYYGLNYLPWGGPLAVDFGASGLGGNGYGSIPVDLNYGYSSEAGQLGVKNDLDEIVQEVNKDFVCIGYPTDPDAAALYDGSEWQDSGVAFGTIMSKIVDCHGKGIDGKIYHSTALASGVGYFARTSSLPANESSFIGEVEGPLTVNPAWRANMNTRLHFVSNNDA